MGRTKGSIMVQIDRADIDATYFDLVKYVNPNVVMTYIPRNIKRTVELLVSQGTHKIEGTKVIKIRKED